MTSIHSSIKACTLRALALALVSLACLAAPTWPAAAEPGRSAPHGARHVELPRTHEVLAHLARLTKQRSLTTGVTARVNWSAADSVVDLQLLEGDSVGQIAVPLNAFLLIQVTTDDPTSLECDPAAVDVPVCRYTRGIIVLGAGEIAHDQLSVTLNTGRLLVDLSALPDFTYSRCVINGIDAPTDCSSVPPSPSLIDLRFQSTRDGYFKSSGTTTVKIGPLISRFSGQELTVSAKATGVILGQPVRAIANASLGTHQSRSVELVLD